MLDLISYDTSQLILSFDASNIQGYSQHQVNVFVGNLNRSISATQATGVLTATFDDLVNGNVGGAQHYSTAPALMDRLLTSLSNPANPTNMHTIALTRELPAGAFTKSPILAQILG